MSTRLLSQIRTYSFLKTRAKAVRNIARNHGHASWNYRKASPPSPGFVVFGSELIMGFTWWWVLWHLFDEYDHITGEWAYPDPREWTDEELGVPSEEQYRKYLEERDKPKKKAR